MSGDSRPFIDRAFGEMSGSRTRYPREDESQDMWNRLTSIGRSAVDAFQKSDFDLDKTFDGLMADLNKKIEVKKEEKRPEPMKEKKIEVKIEKKEEPKEKKIEVKTEEPKKREERREAEQPKRDNGSVSSASSTSGSQRENMSAPNNAREVPVRLVRNRSIDDFNDQMVHMLDEIERRVEQLRETAGMLEAEKESIVDMLSNFNLNTELMRLGAGDREDINATANRLMARTRAVEVLVGTPRNHEQQNALQQVNTLIEGMINKMSDDLGNTKDQCRRFLNACSPEETGPIDQRFQAQVIECTADDQKKIRRKLAQIITQIERAERTCMPQW